MERGLSQFLLERPKYGLATDVQDGLVLRGAGGGSDMPLHIAQMHHSYWVLVCWW